MANVDQMLTIVNQTASDGMRRAAARADQADRIVTQNMSCPRHKQARTDRLHASDGWRCPRIDHQSRPFGGRPLILHKLRRPALPQCRELPVTTVVRAPPATIQ
jgi:hypothetical protein